MREQTAPEHPSEAHERAALARRAFVTSTATDDLAIQAEDCIQERDNSCVQMVPCFAEHIHQPLSLRCGGYIQQEYSLIPRILIFLPLLEKLLQEITSIEEKAVSPSD